jgi:D-alanine-D-alanine ligase
VLEYLGLPYTHSGVAASALAMDKPLAKKVFVQAGLPVPEGMLVSRTSLAAGHDPMPAPYVIKPPNEGSSVGLVIVREGDNRAPLPLEGLGEEVLVERFIPGRELTVAVMGEQVLGVLEITTPGTTYDYAAKYTVGGSAHLVPAPIHPAAYEQACAIALKAHQALGCRGVSRADLRYDDTGGEPGELYLLEVNTQPGMTPVSLLPDIARHAGFDYRALVSWMVEHAECDA